MNSQALGLRVASIVFGLVCLAHLLRIVVRLQVHNGGFYLHRWMSVVAVIVTGFLCLWLWMLSTHDGHAGAKPGAGPGAG